MAAAEAKHQKAHQLAREKKFKEAREMWGQAAKDEHVGAMVCYGTCLLNGMGMPGGRHNGTKVGFGCVTIRSEVHACLYAVCDLAG